jgi:phospholipase/lecithinase/hemolysin
MSNEEISMKGRILSACMAIVAVLIIAVPASARDRDAVRPHTRVVVFGDSLSDPGNYFAAFHEISQRPFAPVPDAPYAMGGLHYSNGETWIEQLGHYLHAGDSAGPALRHPGNATNFAVGRARARPGAEAFPHFDLSTQVGTFLGQTGGQAQEGALYVLWIGANDLKDALESLATDPTFASAVGIVHQAVGTTAGNIQALWNAGARRFLVVDMPDLAITPYLIDLGPVAQYAAGHLTDAYNAGLGEVVDALGALPGISILRLDVNAAIASAALDPSTSRIREFEMPCLRFAVVEDAVCRHPERYLFWDAIHPTTVGHELIADAARAALAAH